jgi:hypothetical protein
VKSAEAAPGQTALEPGRQGERLVLLDHFTDNQQQSLSNGNVGRSDVTSSTACIPKSLAHIYNFRCVPRLVSILVNARGSMIPETTTTDQLREQMREQMRGGRHDRHIKSENSVVLRWTSAAMAGRVAARLPPASVKLRMPMIHVSNAHSLCAAVGGARR